MSDQRAKASLESFALFVGLNLAKLRGNLRGGKMLSHRYRSIPARISARCSRIIPKPM